MASSAFLSFIIIYTSNKNKTKIYSHGLSRKTPHKARVLTSTKNSETSNPGKPMRGGAKPSSAIGKMDLTHAAVTGEVRMMGRQAKQV